MNSNAPSQKVSRSVRSLLASRGETITGLATATLIAESTLKRRLLGHSPFTLEEAGYIASHFNVTIADLLAGTVELSAETVPA